MWFFVLSLFLYKPRKKKTNLLWRSGLPFHLFHPLHLPHHRLFAFKVDFRFGHEHKMDLNNFAAGVNSEIIWSLLKDLRNAANFDVPLPYCFVERMRYSLSLKWRFWPHARSLQWLPFLDLLKIWNLMKCYVSLSTMIIRAFMLNNMSLKHGTDFALVQIEQYHQNGRKLQKDYSCLCYEVLVSASST